MTIQRVMLVLGLCACGDTRGDGPIDDAGAIDGSADSGVGDPDAGTGGSTDINKSGTRLKMRVLNTPDGAKQFSGWYDTQRNEDCSFQVAADGATRCIPLFAPSGASIGAALYADSGCTQRAARIPSCQAVPTTFYDGFIDSCGLSRFRIYPRDGAALAQVWQRNNLGTCVVETSTAGYAFYRVGVEVAPTDFVGGTVAVE